MIAAQSNSIIQSLEAENDSLESVLPQIENFQLAPNLTSDSWDGLKSQMDGHTVIVQGLICANEDVIYDSEELITLSGDEELDEDKIQFEKDQLEAENKMYSIRIESYSSRIQTLGQSAMTYDAANISQMQSYSTEITNCYSYIGANNKAIAKLQAKLDKIKASYISFNVRSYI